mgnify:FL=1
MTTPALLTQQDIAAWLGYQPEQTARIRAWLDENGVRYRLGKGGRVCTTMEALNSAILRQTEQVEFA